MTSENRFNLITSLSSFHLWLLLLGVKLLLGYFVPFSFDEAYYWVWSNHLQLSYFDHPPMVAWLMSLGHFLEGWGYLARLPIILVGHLTIWIWILILREVWKETTTHSEKNFLLIASTCLFLGAGSIIATPDVPLNFFWSLATFSLIKLVNSKSDLFAWAVGASLGLGFVSKYHIVLFPISILLGLLFTKQLRIIRPKWLLQIFVSGLFFCLPVLIWNYQNDWMSFKFQLDHGLAGEKRDLIWVIEYIVGQIFFIGPIALFLFAKNFKSENLGHQVLSFIGAGALLFFLLTSFRAPVEPNWPIMAYFAIYALAIQSKNQRALKTQAIVYFALMVGSFTLLFNPATQLKLGKLSEPFEYKPLIQELQSYAPLFASRYQMASVLWFELGRPVYKVPEISRYDFFESLYAKESFPNKFYVLIHDEKPLPKWLSDKNPKVELIKKYHERLKLIEVNLP